jgi:POT family proton-dependent oligopeptide transporter
LVVVGTGLLKPNISAIVGQLYPEGGARRDAGFTIFYLGINVGATAGPIICGLLGEKVNWHYGFAAAGVGMVLGLIQFAYTHRWLGEAGRAPGHVPRATPSGGFDRAWLGVGIALAAVAAVVAAGLFGMLPLNPIQMAKGTTYVIVGMALLYFAFIFICGKLDRTEVKHVAMIVILFIAAAMFWAGFEQAGSSLNLFAERYTHRLLSWLTIDGNAFEIPASWFQSLNPAFIITLAPLFAMFWVWLAKRNLNPSIPLKFASGLIQLALGFLIMVGAAKLVLSGMKNGQPGQVLPTWLIFTYLLHTMGEICLSPVGLSSVTKLSPPRFVGQMMGTWFMAASLGNLLAGLMAGKFRDDAVEQFPDLYMQVVITSAGVGLLLLIFAVPLRRLAVGVK